MVGLLLCQQRLQFWEDAIALLHCLDSVFPLAVEVLAMPHPDEEYIRKYLNSQNEISRLNIEVKRLKQELADLLLERRAVGAALDFILCDKCENCQQTNEPELLPLPMELREEIWHDKG
jgi:hypothetical protein